MTRLDSLDIGQSSIALLKVDVEGYEKFVFDGADRLLEDIRCICYESAEDHFQGFGYSRAELNDILKAKGFDLFRFVDDRLQRIGESYISEKAENIVAVKDIEDYRKRMGFEVSFYLGRKRY